MPPEKAGFPSTYAHEAPDRAAVIDVRERATLMSVRATVPMCI